MNFIRCVLCSNTKVLVDVVVKGIVNSQYNLVIFSSNYVSLFALNSFSVLSSVFLEYGRGYTRSRPIVAQRVAYSSEQVFCWQRLYCTCTDQPASTARSSVDIRVE